MTESEVKRYVDETRLALDTISDAAKFRASSILSVTKPEALNHFLLETAALLQLQTDRVIALNDDLVDNHGPDGSVKPAESTEAFYDEARSFTEMVHDNATEFSYSYYNEVRDDPEKLKRRVKAFIDSTRLTLEHLEEVVKAFNPNAKATK